MKKSHFLILIIALFSSFFIYKEYFIQGKIPFSANLLASFYVPWESHDFPGWEHGIPNKPLGHDGIRFFLPIKNNIVDQLKNGVFPLWSPYVFAGGPLAANMQSSVYFPTTLGYLLVPLIDAWSLTVVTIPVLSMYFMFLYLRSIGCTGVVSGFVGFLWAYCGFFAVWNQENPAVTQSTVWLPLILYFIEIYAKKDKFLMLICAALASALSFFGGHIQFSLYIFILSTVYLFSKLYKKKKFYLQIILFTFLTLSFSAIQLVPSIESFLLSPRNYENSKYLFDIYLVPLTHFINIITPDWKGNPATYNYFDTGSYYDMIFYVGLIPLLFGIVGYILNKQNKVVRFYSIILFSTLLLGFDNFISDYLFNSDIPFFSSVIPSRIFFVSSFSLLVISSFGVDSLLKNKPSFSIKQLLVVFTIPILLLAVGWIYFFLYKDIGIMTQKQEYPTAMFRNLLLPSILIIISLILFYCTVRFKKYVYIAISILCALAVFHQIYFYSKNVHFSFREFMYPDNELLTYLKENASINRVVGFGKAAIKPNILNYFDIYSPEGLDPLLPGSYAELSWYALTRQTGKDSKPLIEVSFENSFPPNSDIKGTEPIFRLFDLTSTKYFITHKDDKYKVGGEAIKQLQIIDPYTVWEYKSLPRAFLTTNYSIEKEGLIPIFNEAVGSRKIILDSNPGLATQRSCQLLEPTITLYSSREIKIQTSADCDSLLYLSDLYYPGWKAYIDEKETEVSKANYAFRAIKVPQGDHAIRFLYVPTSFYLGSIISGLSFGSVILYIVFVYVKKKRS